MEIEVKKELVYQKGLVEIVEKNFLGEKKSFKFKLSVQTPDRSNDIVAVAGIKLNNYMENPVVLFNHQQELLPIGTGDDLEVQGDVLFGEVTFHEATQLSKDVATLVEQGVLRAVSIGFLPLKVETYPITEEMRKTGSYYPYTNTVRVIQESELIEFSIVAVPANQEALITMGFDNLIDKSGATINKSNLEKLKQALTLITDVIMSAEGPDKPMDPMLDSTKNVSDVTKDETIELVEEVEEIKEVIADTLDTKKYVTDDYLEELLSKIKY